MIKFELNQGYNDLRHEVVGGRVTGIWKGNGFFKGSSSYPIPNFKYYTSEYCDFEKNIISEDAKMVYHLNGYGTLHNEAFSSFLGESAERYTFSSYYLLLEQRIVRASRKEMAIRYGEDQVCDVEVLNGYFARENKNDYLAEEDEIQWLKMNSLSNPEKSIFVPLQMAVSDSGVLFKNEKRFMPAAVSTGTACHENFKDSLKNALIEYMQIDSFNLWWYAGAQGEKIDIDIKELLLKYINLPIAVNEFLNLFNVEFTDISYDKDFDIIVCEIFGKEETVPRYTVGVQGGIGIEKCIYRGFMECLAVLEYNMHLLWINPSKYLSVTKNTVNGIGNLDDNVIYYSKYGKPEKVKHDKKLFSGNRKKGYNIRKNACELSRYACFLDITLPEFARLNLRVTRVILPELLPICLPSYPPYQHLRYKNIGGIQNGYPHPLA